MSILRLLVTIETFPKKKMKSPASSFMFKPGTAKEVELEILALPNNKSHGLYSCPTKLLKYSSTIYYQWHFS